MPVNDPLYVIDGVPVMTGDASEFTYSQSGNSLLSTINSNDIESMTVIKMQRLLRFTVRVLQMVLL